MKIPRVTVLTLGVSDLNKATKFYEAVLGTPPNTSFDGVTFIELPGTWISLYPLEKLAEDISPEVPAISSGFSGYFADLDGHYWEVAWGPMFDFKENGELKFKENA